MFMLLRILLLIGIALSISTPGFAQTFFYQSTLSVSPANPTTSDTIYIYVAGSKSGTDIFLVGSSVTLNGSNVDISLHWASSGIGLTVLVPWDTTFKIGPLAAGTYTANLTGSFMLVQQNNVQFTVAGGGGPQCNELELNGTTKICKGDTTQLRLNLVLPPTAPGWTYSWSTGSTDSIISVHPIASTNYSVTATNGATTCVFDTLVKVSIVTVAVTSKDVVCEDGSNGWAAVSGSGGFPPYWYGWISPPVTDSFLTGLSAGVYHYKVFDALGCGVEDSVTIADGPAVQTNPILGLTHILPQNFQSSYYTDDSSGTPGSTYYWGLIPSTSGIVGPATGPGHIDTEFFFGVQDTVQLFVIETDSNGCVGDTVFLSIFLDLEVGIDESNAETLQVFPNPVSVSGSIKINGIDSPAELRVFDCLGRLQIIKESNSLESISTLGLITGVYFIEVRFKNSIGQGKLMITD